LVGRGGLPVVLVGGGLPVVLVGGGLPVVLVGGGGCMFVRFTGGLNTPGGSLSFTGPVGPVALVGEGCMFVRFTGFFNIPGGSLIRLVSPGLFWVVLLFCNP